MKNTSFGFDKAQTILKEKDTRTLSVILTDLRRSGWLEVQLDSQDMRRRKYTLTTPESIVEKVGKVEF